MDRRTDALAVRRSARTSRGAGAGLAVGGGGGGGGSRPAAPEGGRAGGRGGMATLAGAMSAGGLLLAARGSGAGLGLRRALATAARRSAPAGRTPGGVRAGAGPGPGYGGARRGWAAEATPPGAGARASAAPKKKPELTGLPGPDWAKAQRMAIPAGVSAGIFGSLVGVGGGALITPSLIRACRLPPQVTGGTALCAVLATSTASTYTYASRGHVDWATAIIVGAAALLTAASGAGVAHRLKPETLKKILGVFLLSCSPLAPGKAWAFGYKEVSGESKHALPTLEDFGEMGPGRAAILAAIGAVAGFSSGMFGVGGGVIVTPLLALLTDKPQVEVVGTSLAAMFFPTFVALNTHAGLGNVRWGLGVPLAGATLVGSLIGSNLGLNLPPGAMETLFSCAMLFLGWSSLK